MENENNSPENQTINYTESLQELNETLQMLYDLTSDNHEENSINTLTYREIDEVNRLEYLELIKTNQRRLRENEKEISVYNEALLNELINANDSIQQINTIQVETILSNQNEKINELNENVRVLSETVEPNEIILENQQLERYAYLSIIFMVVIVFPVIYCYRYFMFFFNKLF